MLVCKAWSSVAYEEFHKVLIPTEKNINIFGPALLERRFDQWFQGAPMVKELRMMIFWPTVVVADLYTVLLSYLPNLKVISFDSLSEFDGHYARLLASAADSQQSLQRIQEITIRYVKQQIFRGRRRSNHEI